MAAKPKPNPEEKGKTGDEGTPTPNVPEEGTEEGVQPSEKKPIPVSEESPQGGVDYKIKFAESAREAQRLLGETKLWQERAQELETKLRETERSAPPSEEELAKKNPDWDLLDDVEKKRIKQEAEREKRLRRLEEQLAWGNDFKSLIKQSEFSSIADREDEFKDYAYKYPREVDLPTLARAFLYDKKVGPEKKEEAPERKGLEKPTGGHGKPISTEMTAEDLERLRTTQPKVYEKMLRQGRFDKIKFPKP